ncbi:MAG TPA: hypothetical protein VH370_13885 [Humisphaera sp.]|nr:hypothetical protein [Humisphaera sp.]
MRVVVYREDGAWIAHCLEFDLLGEGETPEAALAMLSNAIELQLAAMIEFDNIENLFKPAEAKFFAMFAAGKTVAVGEIHLKLDSVTIDETQIREYTEGPACGKLAYA